MTDATIELARLGRCAKLAWDHAVQYNQTAAKPRPGVTTGHLLLGVLNEELCAGGLILAKLGIDLKLAYTTTEFVLLHGRNHRDAEKRVMVWGNVPHTPAASIVMELALEEANLYSAVYPIGTEHLLLGLLRVSESTGHDVLRQFGLDVHQVRAARDRLWDLLRSVE